MSAPLPQRGTTDPSFHPSTLLITGGGATRPAATSERVAGRPAPSGLTPAPRSEVAMAATLARRGAAPMHPGCMPVEGSPMPTHKRQADVTVEEAEEAEEAAARLVRCIRDARGDRVVTVAEAAEMERLARAALRATRDVTRSATKTSARQRVAESWLTTLPMNPTVTEVAQDAGIYDEAPLHAALTMTR